MIVLLRDESDAKTSLRRLAPLPVKVIAGIKAVRLSVRIPRGVFRYVLVTSKNALRFQRQHPRAQTWVFIGAKSRGAFRVGHSTKFVELKLSNSQEILEWFRRQTRGSVFFPRSRIADPKIVRDLRKMGFKVSVRHTYTTKILNIRRKLNGYLRRGKIDAFFVTSPSTVKCLQKSFGRKTMKSWPVRWVSIGPTTSAYLSKLGLRPITARQASLEAMKVLYQKARLRI